MTTLGSEHKGKYKGYRIVKRISGDLSYSYSVYDKKGRRYNAATLAQAKKIANKKKQIPIKKFNYLRPKAAKKYVKYAYGDYAESLRKRGKK